MKPLLLPVSSVVTVMVVLPCILDVLSRGGWL
jgi:hypothetical protein